MPDFATTIAEAYAVKDEALEPGKDVLDKEVERQAVVQLPLHDLLRTAADGRGRSRAASVQDKPKPAAGGAAAIGKFLASRQGQRLEREVVRGVFGMLEKSL